MQGENGQEHPLIKDFAKDENGLFSDLEQLRYMVHDLVDVLSDLLDTRVGDFISEHEPILGLELSLKAFVIHEGTCTHKSDKGEGSIWEIPVAGQKNARLN